MREKYRLGSLLDRHPGWILLARLILWILPLLVSAIAYFLLAYEQQRTIINLGLARLMEGKTEAAVEFLSRVVPGLAPPEAGATRILTRLLKDHKSLEGSNVEWEKMAALPLSSLCTGTFFGQDFPASWQLARWAEKAGCPAASWFAAASLVELGQAAEARMLFGGAGRRPGSSLLEKRLRQALDLESEGYISLLRDRQGRLLGGLDHQGQFHFTEGNNFSLIPETIIKEFKEAEKKGSTRISIDLSLSKLALDCLQPFRGSIVILRPQTGEILAAVSDPRTVWREEAPAFEQRREPASIAKIITVTAAFRQGLDPDLEISGMWCRSATRYHGGILWCPYPAGELGGLDHALSISCNVAFANLGILVGRPGLVSEFRQWGFDRKGGNPIAYGRLLEPEGDERQLVDLSIGLEALDITPLHAALMAAVVANNGIMPKPTFFVASDGALGLTPKTFDFGPGHRVVDPVWIPRILQAMQAAAGPEGTAGGLAPVGFPVAMKTGTANEPGRGYHVNYIGIGPLPNPEIAFCVRLTHQPTSVHITMAARRVTQGLLDTLKQWSR